MLFTSSRCQDPEVMYYRHLTNYETNCMLPSQLHLPICRTPRQPYASRTFVYGTCFLSSSTSIHAVKNISSNWIVHITCTWMWHCKLHQQFALSVGIKLNQAAVTTKPQHMCIMLHVYRILGECCKVSLSSASAPDSNIKVSVFSRESRRMLYDVPSLFSWTRKFRTLIVTPLTALQKTIPVNLMTLV